eukprot:8929707-Pyramimonas_sp.AAC.1
MKTPSGHLALKADEYEMATEDQRSMSFTITTNPQCEEAPLLVKVVSGPEPIAGAPAVNDAHAYMMSQDTKGISFSINNETFTFTIQSLVNYTMASQEYVLWGYPYLGRQRLRPPQIVGGDISGHLRGGYEVDASRCTGRDTCGRG